MSRFFIGLVFYLATSHTYAGIWLTQDSTIAKIHSEGNFILITLEGDDFQLADGCDVSNQVVLEDDTKQGDRQMSMLLTAYASGTKVAIYTNGCKDQWNKRYPKIWAVQLKS